MSAGKPFLEMPDLCWNERADADSVLLGDFHEMREKYEARIRELTEWRPMETAPKDGTRILMNCVVYGGPYVLVAYWCCNPHPGTQERWIYEGPLGNVELGLGHGPQFGWLPLPEVKP